MVSHNVCLFLLTDCRLNAEYMFRHCVVQGNKKRAKVISNMCLPRCSSIHDSYELTAETKKRHRRERERQRKKERDPLMFWI